MDERSQFTFYRSFWEAIKTLPKKDKLPILEAIIQYALDGDIPKGLTQSQNAFFFLVKPNLDASRNRSLVGKQNGSKRKANKSKTEANDKQTEGEKEKEIENEYEKENDSFILTSVTQTAETNDRKNNIPEAKASFDGQSFSQFWSGYPDCVSKINRESTYAAWKSLAPSKEQADKIIKSLEAWKASDRWMEKGGKYIPAPANFLAKGYWKVMPEAEQKQEETGKRQLDADEMAAIERIMRGD